MLYSRSITLYILIINLAQDDTLKKKDNYELPVQANVLFPYVKEFSDLWEVTAHCSKHHVTYSKVTEAVLSYLTKILAFSIQSINI